MKSLFTKKSKKVAGKVTKINKAELKNIIGGAETIDSSGLKITSEKTTSFYHS